MLIFNLKFHVIHISALIVSTLCFCYQNFGFFLLYSFCISTYFAFKIGEQIHSTIILYNTCDFHILNTKQLKHFHDINLLYRTFIRFKLQLFFSWKLNMTKTKYNQHLAWLKRYKEVIEKYVRNTDQKNIV